MWKYGLLTAVLSLVFFVPDLMSTAVYYDADFFGAMPVGWLPAVTTVCDIANWVMHVLLALFAVSLYEKHAKARIEEICTRCPEEPGRTEALGRSGGTSLAAALLYFAALLLLQSVFSDADLAEAAGRPGLHLVTPPPRSWSGALPHRRNINRRSL